MSVTFTLYRPIKGLIYTPSKFELANNKERGEYINNSTFNREELNNTIFTGIFNDGLYHKQLHLFRYYFRNSRQKRYLKYIKNNYKDYLIFVKDRINPHYMIPIDEIDYCQGWFVKKEYFNRENYKFMAFTKKNMIKLLNKYIKSNELYRFDSFINNYETNDIFIISF